MISRGHLTRFVPRLLNKGLLFPPALVGFPLTANDFSISVPKVPQFIFPIERSEHHVGVRDLVSAQHTNDVKLFCVVLDKIIVAPDSGAHLQEVLLLLTNDWISKLNVSDTARIMKTLGFKNMSASPELHSVCSALCEHFTVFESIPLKDLLLFLEGLLGCNFNVQLSQGLPMIPIMNKFVGSSCNFYQLNSFVTLANGLGVVWADIGSNLQNEVNHAIRKNLGGADLTQAGLALQSLGKMGFKLSDDNISITVISLARRAFDIAFAPSAHKDKDLTATTHSIVNVFHGLGLMKQNFSHYSPKLQQMIIQAVNVYLPLLRGSDSATMLHSLGCMKVQWRDLNTPTAKRILESLSRVLDSSLTSTSLIDVLQGITLMSMTKRDLNVELQDKLQTSLAVVMKNMTSRQITTAVTCLGTLKVEWNYLNRKCQEAIVSGLIQEFQLRIPLNVAQNIKGLSKLGAKYQHLSTRLQSVMEDSLISCLPTMTSVNFSNTIYHLGKLKMAWQQCSMHFNVSILNCLSTQFVHADRVARLMIGLSSMGVKWRDIPVSSKHVVLDAIQQSLNVVRLSKEPFPELEVSWLMEALSDMKADWNSVPQPVKSAFFDAIEACPKLDNNNLCSVLVALASMQLRWTSLPASTAAALTKYLQSPTVFEQHSEFHVSSSIWALGSMKCVWSTIPAAAMEVALLRAAGHAPLSTTTVSRVMWSFGQMGTSWSELSEALRMKLMESVVSGEGSYNMKELTSTMHALAVLTFDSPCHSNRDITLWNMHYSFVKSLKKLLTEDSMSSSEQSQVQIYLEFLRTTPLGVEMLSRVLPDVSQLLAKTNKQQETSLSNKMTSYHAGVALNTKFQLREYSDKFRIVNEFSGFDSGELPVDLAVYSGTKVVALVEFDGEEHYMASGALHRTDLLKEFMYSMKYPSVPLYRIKNSLVQDRGFQKTGSALTLAILMALGDSKVK